MSTRKTIKDELKLRNLIFGRFLIVNIPSSYLLTVIGFSVWLLVVIGILTAFVFFLVLFPSLYFIHRSDPAALLVFEFSILNKYTLFSQNSSFPRKIIYIDDGRYPPVKYDIYVSHYSQFY